MLTSEEDGGMGGMQNVRELEQNVQKIHDSRRMGCQDDMFELQVHQELRNQIWAGQHMLKLTHCSSPSELTDIRGGSVLERHLLSATHAEVVDCNETDVIDLCQRVETADRSPATATCPTDEEHRRPGGFVGVRYAQVSVVRVGVGDPDGSRAAMARVGL